MEPMSSEPIGDGDHDVDDALVLTGVEAFCGIYTDESRHPEPVEFDAVVVSLTGDDETSTDRTYRFIVPIEGWPDVARVIGQAVRSFEMGRAMANARVLERIEEDLLMGADDGSEGIQLAFDDFAALPVAHPAGADSRSDDDRDENDSAGDEGDGPDDEYDERFEWASYDDVDLDSDDDEDDAFSLPPDEAELAWERLAGDLTAVLGALEPGCGLTLLAPAQRFVHMVVFHAGAQVETVSNQLLDDAYRLSLDDLDLLESVGWQGPTAFVDEVDDDFDGCLNHHVRLPTDWDREAAARLLITTLRTVHDVYEPSQLRYRSFNLDSQILVPTLGLSRHIRPEEER